MSGCCWWWRGWRWCSEGGGVGWRRGWGTSGSFGAEYKRRTWVGPGIRDALAGYSTTSGSGEAEVGLCSVRIVHFYKVARARMLNLGIHRLAYLLFLMVVLSLFWTTNFPCKIFCRHPLGFVKIDFEPPDLSPLGTVLWGHPLRHSWRQEKKKTAWNLSFPSRHITRFYETEYFHCPPHHVWCIYSFISDVSKNTLNEPPRSRNQATNGGRESVTNRATQQAVAPKVSDAMDLNDWILTGATKTIRQTGRAIDRQGTNRWIWLACDCVLFWLWLGQMCQGRF